MLRIKKLSAATAVAAVFSMLATPVAALDLPRPAAVEAFDGDALNADRHRRHWDDDDIDGGDVLAGVLILGGIAAIASAASKNRERQRETYPYPPPPNPDAGYRTPGYDGAYGSRGIDRAVDRCVYEVERRSDRVGSVDSATRSPDGWHISGELDNGAPYACEIGNDGDVSDVFVGDNGVAYEGSGGQYDDDYYARARAGQGYPGNDGVADEASNDQYDDDYYTSARAGQQSAPSYPGDDGRYETSQTPDFEQ